MEPGMIIATLASMISLIGVILAANYRSNNKIDNLRIQINGSIKDVHGKIDSLDDKFMRKNHAGDILARIDKDIQNLSRKIDKAMEGR